MAWTDLPSGILEEFVTLQETHHPNDYLLLLQRRCQVKYANSVEYQKRNRKRLSALEATRKAARPKRQRIGEGIAKVSYHR